MCHTLLTFLLQMHCTETVLFKNFCNQHCLHWSPRSQLLFKISNAFNLHISWTLHNQIGAPHWSMKKTFLLPLQILLSAYKKTASDCYFVADATFTYFTGHATISYLLCFSYNLQFHMDSCIHSFPAAEFVCIINLSTLQKKGKGKVQYNILCSTQLSKIIFLCCKHSTSSIQI